MVRCLYVNESWKSETSEQNRTFSGPRQTFDLTDLPLVIFEKIDMFRKLAWFGTDEKHVKIK